jgi:hypothetical protein
VHGKAGVTVTSVSARSAKPAVHKRPVEGLCARKSRCDGHIGFGEVGETGGAQEACRGGVCTEGHTMSITNKCEYE